MKSTPLSIIIPLLNERANVERRLERIRSIDAERVWVDGGSNDGTAEFLSAKGELLLTSLPGRGRQLEAGARRSTGEILLFLHVDVSLPEGAADRIRESIASGAVAGAFSLSYDPADSAALRRVARFANIRTRWTGIPFGDQAIYCTRRAWETAGGFRPIPIMEDVDFVARLRRVGPVDLRREAVVASARRFRRQGIARTVINDWRCQLGWMLGVAPERLARWYDLPDRPPAPGVRGSESPRDS